MLYNNEWWWMCYIYWPKLIIICLKLPIHKKFAYSFSIKIFLGIVSFLKDLSDRLNFISLFLFITLLAMVVVMGLQVTPFYNRRCSSTINAIFWFFFYIFIKYPLYNIKYNLVWVLFISIKVWIMEVF